MGQCRAVNTHKEAWRLKTEPWRVCTPVVGDSHDFDEDPDPDLHLSEKPVLDPRFPVGFAIK
jgi:hypothetical protein